MRIEYHKSYTTVYNCYEYNYTAINIIGKIIYRTRKERKLQVTRTDKSYANEIRAHKRLYKLGLFRARTSDADLEENIKWYKELFYNIIGR